MSDESTGSALRRGPFRVGDKVQLSDPKGRLTTITLAEGGRYHTHRGWFSHEELIGASEGSVVTSSGGIEYLALRPLLSDFVLSMPRGATVIYPKDAGQIVVEADIYPGARVVEAGVGSGGLTLSLLRAVGEGGSVLSIERREDFAEVARGNVENFFGGPHPGWRLEHGDFADVLPAAAGPGTIDRIILDMLAPWENIDEAARALAPGGVLLAYVTTTTQLSRFAEDTKTDARWTEPVAWETVVRGWHLEGLAVRPDHRMVAHTGFLITVRRLAPGVAAPSRRRRPAPGAYSEPLAEVDPEELAHDLGTRGVSAKRIRRIHRSHAAARATRARQEQEEQEGREEQHGRQEERQDGGQGPRHEGGRADRHVDAPDTADPEGTIVEPEVGNE